MGPGRRKGFSDCRDAARGDMAKGSAGREPARGDMAKGLAGRDDPRGSRAPFPLPTDGQKGACCCVGGKGIQGRGGNDALTTN